MTEEKRPRAGRPPKSPEGRRVVHHITLSPEATEVLAALCRTPIAPLAKSHVLEHLILKEKRP
jgi:hypothetical protein